MSQVPIDDQGFRWGRGVFETVVVRNGQPEWLDEHRQSMETAARAIGLTLEILPGSLSAPVGNGIWRWFLTPSGFYTSWEEGIPPAPEAVSLSVSPLRLSAASWEARYKTLAYLTRIQAREEAKTDEVVLLNERGEVTGASMANLFMTTSGDAQILTPPHSSGCRAGVVRRWVMEHSGKSVTEKILTPDDLRQADEIFITNSRIGICPVSHFAETSFSNHPTAKRLQEAFRQTTG